MNRLMITLLSTALLSLAACNKPAPSNLPDEPASVPVPQSSMPDSSNSTSPSVDEGIDAGTKQEKSGDEGIEGEPVKPNGDPAIIIPPPKADMPPDIVPEKP